MYCSINNISDTAALQHDLDILHNWSITWNMKFNTDKCHTIRFSLKRTTNIIASYFMGGSLLSTVSEYPYLGLTLSSNMSWQKHINSVTAKANRMLGLVRRNLRGSSQKLRQKAYVSLVRPHLEYCSTVWNPYTQKDISKVENIQRQAARFVVNNYRRRESVTAMLQNLKWTSLEKRRQAASLVMMYRIHHQQVAIDPSHYLTPLVEVGVGARLYQPLIYQVIRSRIQIYEFSFFPRTVNWWNQLPHKVLALPTAEAFKGAVVAHI